MQQILEDLLFNTCSHLCRNVLFLSIGSAAAQAPAGSRCRVGGRFLEPSVSRKPSSFGGVLSCADSVNMQ